MKFEALEYSDAPDSTANGISFLNNLILVVYSCFIPTGDNQLVMILFLKAHHLTSKLPFEFPLVFVDLASIF